MSYELHASERFKKNMKKLNKSVRERIDDIIVNKIAEHPYRYSDGALKADLKGKRKRWVGNYRIIFAVCEECRKNNMEDCNNCSNCNQKSDLVITLFDVGHRGSIYQ